MKMRSFGFSAVSLLLTGLVIGNAYIQKKQFYPSVVYITKSNTSMAVIYIQFFVIVLMLGKLLRKIFLGTLRAAEFEHLMEKFWYALTETCLAFTVFRDDFNPRFVALFTVLLFLKSFHWLAEDRVDYMERSPMISWLFHIRVASLLTVLGSFDYLMIMHAYSSTITKGPSVQLVFGFEYAILITMVANTTIKYVLHGAEMRADTPWENKAVFLLYTELVIGLIKVILYVLFVVIMAKIYALPMFVFRPMFYTMRNFKKALNDVIMSRRAIRNMNTLYPDATAEELEQSDNICIICREDMVSSSKKLPCGHIFHTACLRSWFQRQQTCPTCRLNILRTPQVNSTQLPRQEAVNAAQNLNQNMGGGVGGGAGGAGGGNTGTPVIGAGAAGNQQPPFNNNNIQNQNPNPFSNLFPIGNLPNFPAGTNINISQPNILPVGASSLPPFGFPPFSFMTPFSIPPPPMPPNLDTLSDDELRVLEGNERHHVEERIKLLRNIQLLLDASVALMNQYTTITANLPPMPIVIPTVAAAAAGETVATTSRQSSTSQEPSASVLVDTTECSNIDQRTSPASPTSNKDKPSSSSCFSLENQLNDEKTLMTTVRPETTAQVQIEDLGSEEHIDGLVIKKTPLPETSKVFIKDATVTETSTDEDPSALSELRRRRLQKFLSEELNENTTID